MTSPGERKITFPTDRPVDQKVKDFIARFYAISDDPSRNEEWVDCFLPWATVLMGDKQAVGDEAIRSLRLGMWDQVQERLHGPLDVFPASFGGPGIEYMVCSWLYLTMKNGEHRVVSWAARAVLEEADGELKYRYYQVYLQDRPSKSSSPPSTFERARERIRPWLGPVLFVVIFEAVHRYMSD